MRSVDYPDLSVVLTVGGVPLEEYDDEAADDASHGTTSRYVEATSGSSFAVRIEAHRRMASDKRDCVLCRILLDGTKVISRILRVGTQPHHLPLVATIEGRDENTKAGVLLRRFTFANLQTNDDPASNMKKQDFENLGEVTARCYWVRSAGETTSNSAYSDQESSSSIPEKCLKGRAISNRATLGKAAVWHHPASTFVDVSYPYGKEPFADFTFNYRSHRDLQIEGIISRSPTPIPLEERDPATLSREEAIELLERRNRERLELKHVKREKRERSVDVDDDDAKLDSVQITGSRSKRPRASTDSGIEIVDLTNE